MCHRRFVAILMGGRSCLSLCRPTRTHCILFLSCVYWFLWTANSCYVHNKVEIGLRYFFFIVHFYWHSQGSSSSSREVHVHACLSSSWDLSLVTTTMQCRSFFNCAQQHSTKQLHEQGSRRERRNIKFGCKRAFLMTKSSFKESDPNSLTKLCSLSLGFNHILIFFFKIFRYNFHKDFWRLWGKLFHPKSWFGSLIKVYYTPERNFSLAGSFNLQVQTQRISTLWNAVLVKKLHSIYRDENVALCIMKHERISLKLLQRRLSNWSFLALEMEAATPTE